MCIVCGQNVEFVNVKLVVNIVTTMLRRVKPTILLRQSVIVVSGVPRSGPLSTHELALRVIDLLLDGDTEISRNDSSNPAVRTFTTAELSALLQNNPDSADHSPSREADSLSLVHKIHLFFLQTKLVCSLPYSRNPATGLCPKPVESFPPSLTSFN